jgi:hypothetical protein
LGRVLAISLLTVAVGVLAVSALPASAKERTYYPNCQGKARYKPRTVTVFCADGGMVVKRLKWYRWRSTSARGRSRYAYVNDCTPDCADGKFHRYRARLVLKRVRRCESSGRKVFTRMVVIFGRHHPSGLTKLTQRLFCPS